MTPTTARACACDTHAELMTSKGDVILIDAADVAGLPPGFLFIANGYARIQVKRWPARVIVPVHRWVMGLSKGDGKIVDHINGNRLDNRRVNLRLVTRSINALNRRAPYASSSTGLLGVRHDPRRLSKPFVAAMMLDQKHVHIGTFATAEEAHAAYMRTKEPLIANTLEATQ